VKEWLEFFGGFFAFLAVLIPIIRGSWRTLRRKISPRELMLLFIAIPTLGTFFAALIGLPLGWGHAIETLLFLLCLLGLLGLFTLNPSPLTRFDIGGFGFGAITAATFASHEFKEMEEQDRHKTIQEITAPSPSPKVDSD
jgi:hypothetical protein